MSTFLTLHSKKALFTHGNLTAKSSGNDSVELFKVDGGTKEVTVTKDADTIFKQSDGSTDLLKIHPSDADSELANKITSQAGVIMKTLDGNKNLLSLDASNTDTGLTAKTNVNLQTEGGTDLLILDAVSQAGVASLQAPYLQVNTQFKTSGETELDGAVNITGVTTVSTSFPHNLSVGDNVVLSGVAFTCDYLPSVGVVTASYDHTSGILTVTTASAHGLAVSPGKNSDVILTGLAFTCGLGATVPHIYPRNTDVFYDTAISVGSTTATTITLDVGRSGAKDQYAHTFVGTAGTFAVMQGGD